MVKFEWIEFEIWIEQIWIGQLNWINNNPSYSVIFEYFGLSIRDPGVCILRLAIRDLQETRKPRRRYDFGTAQFRCSIVTDPVAGHSCTSLIFLLRSEYSQCGHIPAHKNDIFVFYGEVLHRTDVRLFVVSLWKLHSRQIVQFDVYWGCIGRAWTVRNRAPAVCSLEVAFMIFRFSVIDGEIRSQP
jgi:hypothetical protein